MSEAKRSIAGGDFEEQPVCPICEGKGWYVITEDSDEYCDPDDPWEPCDVNCDCPAGDKWRVYSPVIVSRLDVPATQKVRSGR